MPSLELQWCRPVCFWQNPQPCLPQLSHVLSVSAVCSRNQGRGWISYLGQSKGIVNPSVNGTSSAEVDTRGRRESKVHLEICRPFREGFGPLRLMGNKSKLISSRSQGPEVPCRHWMTSRKLTGPFAWEEVKNSRRLWCLGSWRRLRNGLR